MDDPTRYVIVSAFSPRFLLFYDVTSNSYPMNDLRSATLFKRRSVAHAVLSALGGGHVLMTVRVAKDGAITRVTPLREILAEARHSRWRRNVRRSSGRRSRRFSHSEEAHAHNRGRHQTNRHPRHNEYDRAIARNRRC
jgi:hypothetical protein